MKKALHAAIFVLIASACLTAQSQLDLLKQARSLIDQAIAQASSKVPLTYKAVTDRTPRPKPALPALGPAGTVFKDPTFGTRLLRVTDANMRATTKGVSFRTPSETPNRAWNTTAMRFYAVSTDGSTSVFDFAPATLTATLARAVQFNTEPEFSALDPDALYGGWTGPGDEAIVQRYDCKVGGTTRIVGVRDLVPTVDANGRTYLRGVETGAAAGREYMTFTFGGTHQDDDRDVAWFPLGDLGAKKLLDTVASTLNGKPTNVPLGFRVHAVEIDQSGRFVVIGPVNAQPATNVVWDTMTDTFTVMKVSSGGHGAPGWGSKVNQPDDQDGYEFRVRDLAAPDVTRLLVPLQTPADFQISGHLSWANAQPEVVAPVFVSPFRYLNSGPWRAWDDEIVAIGKDGVVYRFCHHRTDVRHDTNPQAPLAFWYTPRVNVSPDGRFALFTSNWEKTLGTDPFAAAWEGNSFRQDVFLVAPEF